MSIKLCRVGLLLLLIIIIGFSKASLALAHAELVRSDPPANASLPVSPNQVQLWFSEDIEPSFSEITVLDKNGQRKEHQNSHVVDSDRKSMIVTVPQLERGTYTVFFRTLSETDGHVVKGGFPFAVGEAVSADALLTSAQPPQPPAVLSVMARWLNLLSAMPAVGGFIFLLLVRNPVLKRIGVRPEDEAALDRRFLLTSKWAVGGLLIAGACLLVAYAASAAGVSPIEALGAPIVKVLTSTRYGTVWTFRILLVVALAGALALFSRSAPSVRRSRRMLIGGFVVGAALLLTDSLNSHGAATGNKPAINLIVDWAHILAATLWLGGLAHFLGVLTTPKSIVTSRTMLVAALIPRFTRVALGSFSLLVVTGLYSAVLHVPDFQALLDTQYGNALTAKLLALGALGLFGLVNGFFLGPRLVRSARGAAGSGATLLRRFRTAIGVEVTAGLLLLLAVGVMTSVAPARTAISVPGMRPLTMTTETSDVSGTLRVTPYAVGFNAFEMSLQDSNGQPVQADRLTLRFTMRSHDMGVQELRLEPVGDGDYRTPSSNLSMAGPWKVEAQVRRQGMEDVVIPFELGVANEHPGKQAAQTPPIYPVPADAPVLALELLLLAALCAVLATGIGVRRGVFGLGLLVIAVVTGSLGGVLAASAQFALQPSSEVLALQKPNPARSKLAVSAGELLYKQYCVVCHGEEGKGDGPAARGLVPRPVDFTQHINLHPAGRVYDWISNGVPGTAMPAWGTQLTPEDRWNIYNYLKTVFGNTPGAAKGPY